MKPIMIELDKTIHWICHDLDFTEPIIREGFVRKLRILLMIFLN